MGQARAGRGGGRQRGVTREADLKQDSFRTLDPNRRRLDRARLRAIPLRQLSTRSHTWHGCVRIPKCQVSTTIEYRTEEQQAKPNSRHDAVSWRFHSGGVLGTKPWPGIEDMR